MREKIFTGGMRKMGAGILLAAASLALNASGAGIIYQFDNSFSGAVPTGTAPWVTANIQNTSGGVDLTISTAGLTSGEFLGSLYLNINPSYNVNNLTFSFLGGTAGVSTPTIQTGEDGFKADGDGKYDILFSFDTSNAGVFGAGDTMSFFISGISGLNANDFVYLSTPAGGNGPFDAAGHIQGIGANGDSAWVNPSQGAIVVPVPEPGSYALLLLAAGLIGGWRLWLRRARA